MVALMLSQWKPNRFEQILYRGPLVSDQSSILAGVSRSLRISAFKEDARERVVKDISASLVGPLTFLFVWWVLDQAKKQGIRRLYFLARDGQLFFKVAEILVKEWKLDIELRYLYCSRESLLLPSFKKVGPFERYWITWDHLVPITPVEFCRRLGLTLLDLTEPLKAAGLSGYLDNPDHPISLHDKSRFETLLDRADVLSALQEKVSDRFRLTVGYLLQEGLGSDILSAVVDTGWRASSHYAISNILNSSNIDQSHGLLGFYIGINRNAFCRSTDVLNAFLFDWRTERQDHRLNCFLCFEMLFSADHGRTVGYRLDGTHFSPVVNNSVNESFSWAVAMHHRIAVQYAERASSVLLFGAFSNESAEVCRRLARAFICNPTLDEATVYGNWPIAGEIMERDIRIIAPEMDLQAALHCALGLKKIPGFWPQASLLRGKQRFAILTYNALLSLGLFDQYRQLIVREKIKK